MTDDQQPQQRRTWSNEKEYAANKGFDEFQKAAKEKAKQYPYIKIEEIFNSIAKFAFNLRIYVKMGFMG